MSPLEYEERYHKVLVLLDDLSTTTVDIHIYQLNGNNNAAALVHKDEVLSKLRDSEVEEEQAEAAEEKAAKSEPDWVQQHRLAAIWHNKTHAALVAFENINALVHMGKGSPEEIGMVLSYVAKKKLYDKHLDARTGIKNYSEKFVGLDCNGFVGNFAKVIGKPIDANTPIENYVSDQQKLRGDLRDILNNDVLVWLDNGHIAIIDSIGAIGNSLDNKPSRDCVVVESTAATYLGNKRDGLQHSNYSIRATADSKIFEIERPKGGGKDTVKIATLG